MFCGQAQRLGVRGWLILLAASVGTGTLGCGGSSGAGDLGGPGTGGSTGVDGGVDRDAVDAFETGAPDSGDVQGRDQADDQAGDQAGDQTDDAVPGDAGDDAADAVDAVDGAMPDDGPPTLQPSGLPLPADMPPPRRLLDARATLTGGRSIGSCSHQEPASGDGHRWCAFSIAGTPATTTELWVIDATRAAAGDVPVCDGSNAGCQRLTTNLWTEFPLIGPGHPYAHAFDGDTLIFYADATSGKDQVHRGPVYAWRPGWVTARQLTSENGLLCTGDRRRPLAICMDDLQGDPVKPDSIELRAGRLVDGATGVLPSVGRFKPAFAEGVPSWQAAFAPSGDLLAVSAAFPLESATEILRVIPTDSIGIASPTPIITDASSWAISNDGKSVYYYLQQSGDLRELFIADFPSGNNIRRLAQNVTDYVLMGDGPADQGVIFTSEINTVTHERALLMLSDVTAPDSARIVFKYFGFLEGVELSKDLRYTTWLSSGFLASVVRNDTLASCVLNTSHDWAAFDIEILASVGLVFWTEDAADGLFGRDAFVTTPDACAPKQRFARAMYWYTPVGDRGLVFGDEYGGFERTVTMKYASVTHQGDSFSLDPPVRIDALADPEFIVLGDSAPLLLYVKQHGDAATTGTYVFGPLFAR